MPNINSIRRYLNNLTNGVPGPFYEKWFGTYNAERYEAVKAAYTNMTRVTRDLTFYCVRGNAKSCRDEEARIFRYGYVDPNQFSTPLDFLHIYTDNPRQKH